MKHIHFCVSCKQYSMKQECPACGKKTELARPPKYSVPDKYGDYRRQLKEKERKEAGKMN